MTDPLTSQASDLRPGQLCVGMLVLQGVTHALTYVYSKPMHWETHLHNNMHVHTIFLCKCTPQSHFTVKMLDNTQSQ